MDDTKRTGLLFILLVVFGFAANGFAAKPDLSPSNQTEIEFISLEKSKDLEKQFEAANPTIAAGETQNKEWNCDMYGMRSRMQVRRNLHLYNFKENWQNQGAQPITAYQQKPEALTGQTEKLQDQIKKSKDGTLISKLTQKSTNQLLAISICTETKTTASTN